MRKIPEFLYLIACFVILMGVASSAWADSAEVMPKGIFSATTTGDFYLPITKRFTPDGDTEDLAADFNAVLNSKVFPDLGKVETAFGLRPGSANIGTGVVSFEYQLYDLILQLQYGVTDRFSVGIKVPYYWNQNSVEARLDTTRATVGLNPFFGTPGDPFKGAQIIPLKFGGVPLTTKQVKDLLSGGLDINHDGKVDIPGFGFKEFKSFSENGISDVEVGGRYQYLNTKDWRLAFTGGARFPTGKLDDPDDLADIGFGSGAYALLFRLNNDYTGINNLLLNATFRYDLLLPDSTVKRIPDAVNRPLTTNRESVDRDLGDIIELETSATYQITETFSASLQYKYSFKLKDEVSGKGSFSFRSLEDQTDWTAHYITPGLSFSTIPWYKAKTFPIPFTISLSYEDVFAGTNRYLKQGYFVLALTAYF